MAYILYTHHSGHIDILLEKKEAAIFVECIVYSACSAECYFCCTHNAFVYYLNLTVFYKTF